MYLLKNGPKYNLELSAQLKPDCSRKSGKVFIIYFSSVFCCCWINSFKSDKNSDIFCYLNFFGSFIPQKAVYGTKWAERPSVSPQHVFLMLIIIIRQKEDEMTMKKIHNINKTIKGWKRKDIKNRNGFQKRKSKKTGGIKDWDGNMETLKDTRNIHWLENNQNWRLWDQKTSPKQKKPKPKLFRFKKIYSLYANSKNLNWSLTWDL